MTVTANDLAVALRKRRRHLGLSQAQAAQAIGASEKSWRRWEQGAMPDERFLAAIEEHFGITPTPTPKDEAAQALADAERAISAVREGLDRAASVRADVVMRRPDGATVLVEVKGFRGDAGVEEEAVALIGAAAHEAGWIVHVEKPHSGLRPDHTTPKVVPSG